MPAAYQDENRKWFKQCSKTGTLFGPVENKEDLSQWFNKNKSNKDGLSFMSKQTDRTRNRKYRQDNLEKEITRRREYYSNNLNKEKNTRKEWRKKPLGMFSIYKKRARDRGINFTLTLEWFEEQMTKSEFNSCYYSGINFVDQPNHAFSRSLDRISSTKGYTPDNVRWVCFKLNSWKSDLTLDEVAIMFNAMAKHHNADPFEVLKKVEDSP